MITLQECPETVLERLAHTAPDVEIWWDSSPLVYQSWAGRMLATVVPEKRSVLTEQLHRYYDPGNPAALFRGVTTNPPLSLAAIQDDPERWTQWITGYLHEHPDHSVEEVFWALYKEIVRLGADAFRSMFEASGYRYGYISGQVDPRQAFDADRMLQQAQELSALAPNVMIKVPGTAEGLTVLRRLTAQGVSTNCTLAYVVPQFVAVAEAVQSGLLQARANGVDLTRWRSVVTDMCARWENAPEFEAQAAQAGVELTPERKRWAGVAIFKRAYQIFRARAYPSKMLLCSVRMGPTEEGRLYVRHLEETAGADVVITLPPSFLTEFLTQADHIKFEPRIWKDIPDTEMACLQQVPYFNQAYESDGIASDQFNTLPPLVSTYHEFAAATEKMVAFVRERVKQIRQLEPPLPVA
jgi:transaldolase